MRILLSVVFQWRALQVQMHHQLHDAHKSKQDVRPWAQLPAFVIQQLSHRVPSRWEVSTVRAAKGT